ncbi:glucosamine-6-phosphate deaminase [Tetragenococcus halophilus]|uniref:Glucosamine-6-phosphate deaminase n=1 Tax=Tetragenococcus halophilus subsp. halophilus TaxID=1513897 RepID=A0A2H6CV19_TETHA|nr:glucosamine-6-phosphate deaminase [Tetragenococcus halophilus]MCO8292467.1 glucosamine-6-phosphate deaminase [Tetragenococcus halophilus]QXN87118.1 glucosamine-6-phosphate deaminase [Tetragenococcus halophilus]GBD68843.1 glucosamine-6-phosphate deaminase [Tetragenococcus halophilus subsp. halophilus]GBD79507.1 glucosamine-6-phosphate deaminase [Tetragenococcus halophilus subsp. halophilus]GBD81834.1 glucosamine-6-phosphate deaminase [Tetragenococcus halophilus subsp. halophilus]
MDVIRVKNADEGGKKAFEIIKDGIANGADTFGLATGSTPETMYSYMIESDMDFSDKVSVNLDEYVGLDGNNEQSYRYFMDQHLFNHKPFEKTYVPNGKAQDLDAECQRYDDIIAANPIDIQVLGIGQNGHIGFNEPGTSFEATTHVVELTESTVNANKRYFDKVEDVPTRALTMGIQSIMKSKKIILMAFGEAKAEAIKGMIDGKVTEDLPASVLQKHDDVVVIIDKDAASKL